MAASDNVGDKTRILERLTESLLEPEADDKCYEILEKIGKGGFGEVSKCIHRESGERRAMKKLPFDKQGKANVKLKREIRNVLNLRNHRNIVKLLDIFKGLSDHLYIVMELCREDLASFLERKENRKEDACLNLALHIARGLKALHEQDPPIVHRDIKPQNILITAEDCSGSRVAKLTDFGISCIADVSETCYSPTMEELVRSIETMKTTNGHGTLPFMAPEIFRGRDGVGLTDGKFVFDESVDIFALGLVFLYMFCYNDNDYVSTIRQGICDGLGEDMYEACKSGDAMPEAIELFDDDSANLRKVKHLIVHMTSFDAKNRPSAEQVFYKISGIHKRKSMTDGTLLAQLATCHWEKTGQAQLKVFPNYAIRHINQQLWCCCSSAGIVVLDIDLQQQKTISADDMNYVYDVAAMSDGDLVIAAYKGLFHAGIDGNTKHHINSARFSSVISNEDQVYSLAIDKPRRVIVYKHSGSTWVKVHSFSVALSGHITLSVKNNQINCCSVRDCKIAVYSMSGELLQAYSPERNGVIGKLDWPLICDDDHDGSVLIADRDNNRLQVMTEQGEFSVLHLRPPVSRPTSTTFIKNNLYVTSHKEKVIYKYTFDG